MERIYPVNLAVGDEIRIIAPARSLAIISTDLRDEANQKLGDLGLRVSFGKHAEEIDNFDSSTVNSRVEDLVDAFEDNDIKAILTVIGGYNSNQLLRYINWDSIKNNPKVFCGFSDITALNHAILTKTGLVTYSGPHYSSFGQRFHFDYTLDYFKKCLFTKEPYRVVPSSSWSDDEWYRDQEGRKIISNEGWLTINEGSAEGTILGANISTFSLLQGTEYFPSFDNSILFLEDYQGSSLPLFDRDLQSLIHQDGFSGVKGIVIGRFQKASAVTNEGIIQVVKTKKELNKLPVLANVDFGHTDPKITFPIGGMAKIGVEKNSSSIEITSH